MGRAAKKGGGFKVLVELLALVGLVGLLGAPTAHAQEPIKIGFIYPDTGPFAQPGIDMRDGYLLFWSQVGNKAGGRPVESLIENKGTCKPDEGLTKARKVVERDRVHIVGGVICTPVALALRGYVVEKKIPFMIMNAGGEALTQKLRSKYVFRSSFTNSDSGHPLGEWAYKQGYRKAVIMASDFVAGYEQVGAIARTFVEAGGQVIQEIYPPTGAPDFAPYLAQIRKDADVVAAFFGGADGLRFVKQYAEFGLKGKMPLIAKGFMLDEVILPSQGEDAVGIVSSLHWSAALDTPANKRFLEAYQTRFKRPATTFAEQGYVGAQMIAQALDAVKGNVENQEAFLAALQKVDVDAPRGRVRLDAYNNPIHPIHIRKVGRKDGVLQNTVIFTYPNVSQFWKWTPEAFMAMPTYPEMKNKWVK